MRLLAQFSLFPRLGIRHFGALGLLAFLCAANAPAFADEPFDLESTSWMSFDRYKEHPSVWTPPPEGPVAPVVMAPPPVVPPARPVALPVMPGVNKGFDVRVSTTMDDDNPAQPKLTDLDNKPDLQLPVTSWQNASQVARHGMSKKKDAAEDENQPLDVRLTYLPNTEITPATVPARKPQQRITPVPAAQEPPPAVTPAIDPAVCAALEAYKKRQLEAIASDRATLKALQTAISQLGLEKDLNFMAGAGGSVTAEDNRAVLMDMPVQPPAKN